MKRVEAEKAADLIIKDRKSQGVEIPSHLRFILIAGFTDEGELTDEEREHNALYGRQTLPITDKKAGRKSCKGSDSPQNSDGPQDTAGSFPPGSGSLIESIEPIALTDIAGEE